MKKLVLSLLLVSFLLYGCTPTPPAGDPDPSGTVTEDSKHFLDKGYYLYISHELDFPPASLPAMDYYDVKFVYNVVNEYTSDHIPNPTADYNIKEVVVTNMEVKSHPTLGTADTLFGHYSLIDQMYPILSPNDTYVKVFEVPNTDNYMVSVAVEVNEVVTIRQDEYPDSMEFEAKYADKGVTSDKVRLTLAYTVELHTVGGLVFYLDYEFELPPADYDVTVSGHPELDFFTSNPDEFIPFKLK